VIYAAISASSLINDSSYLNKIGKVKVQFDTHYKDMFPIQKDWLPGEWETNDANGWDKYMKLFAPHQPDNELETLTNRLREAVKCSKLDSMAELQSGQMLYLPSVLKYADMVTVEARADFLEGNYKEGMSKLYNFAVFSIDLFTASTRLPEALTALDCFHKIYRELIPLLLNRELFKDKNSLSPYEAGSLAFFGEIVKDVKERRPDTFDFATPPVREEDIEAVMMMLQSFEKLTAAALNKFEPKVVLEKEYLRLGKNADGVFRTLGMKKSDYHIYGKLFYWNQFFSINRYYYRKGIAFYDDLFERMEDISSMYDKSKLINRYYKKNAGDYGSGALVADGPQLVLALTTARTFGKLVSVIFTINRFGAGSNEFLNLKATGLFIDELTGKQFELTEDDPGFSIRLTQGVTLALKKRDYRQGHKDILNSFKPFDLKTGTRIRPFFESR
ncbi:MAG: hypothetical protein GY950_18470, partial [bacterium]|nr:hypothetical protein [bacterium]